MLDVGAGNGAYTLELAKRFAEVVAIDVEPERLAALRAHLVEEGASGVTAIRMSVAALDVAGESFDAVTAIEVLEHVLDLPASIGEIRRVLRPGGIAYVSVPNRLFPLETHSVRVPGIGEFDGRRLPFLPYVGPLHRRISTARTFTGRGLVRLFVPAGFELLGVTHVMPPFDNWQFGKRWLRPVTTRLEASPFGRFGVSILAAFRATSDGTRT